MTPDLNNLRNTLLAFDGKAITILGEIEARCGMHSDYLDQLVVLAGDPASSISSGATWLLKSHLEKQGELSGAQTESLVLNVGAVKDWSAQLHLCQSVRFLEVTDALAEPLVTWLDPLLAHQRPFLRAWSLDALCDVAKHHTRFMTKAQHALKAAHADPAASVKARARNIDLP